MTTEQEYWAQYDQSIAQEVARAQRLAGGYTQPTYTQQQQQSGNTLGSIADSANTAYQAGGLFGGGATAATAANSALFAGSGTATAAASASGLGAGGGIMAGLEGVAADSLARTASSSLAPLAAGTAAQTGLSLLGPIGLGLYGAFNMPASGMGASKAINDARIQNKYDTDVKPIYDDYLASAIPEGMTQMEYNMSRQPPTNPMQTAIDQAYKEGGDIDNRISEIEQFYKSGYGKTEMDGFLADNADWFNSNGTRTDYAGEYAPSLSDQRNTAGENFGAHNVADPNSVSGTAGETYNTDGTSNYGSAPIATYNGGGLFSNQAPLEPQKQPSKIQAPRQGGIYGEGVARQTLNGQDLYADQTLYNSPKYKGY